MTEADKANADVEAAMAFLREMHGGNEPYAPNVWPVALALRSHDIRRHKAIIDVCEEAIETGSATSAALTLARKILDLLWV